MALARFCGDVTAVGERDLMRDVVGDRRTAVDDVDLAVVSVDADPHLDRLLLAVLDCVADDVVEDLRHAIRVPRVGPRRQLGLLDDQRDARVGRADLREACAEEGAGLDLPQADGDAASQSTA